MNAVSETFLMSGSVMSRERSCLSLRRVLRNASHGSALGRTASSFRQHQEPCLGASISAIGPSAKFLAPAKKRLVIGALQTRFSHLEFFALIPSGLTMQQRTRQFLN